MERFVVVGTDKSILLEFNDSFAFTIFLVFIVGDFFSAVTGKRVLVLGNNMLEHFLHIPSLVLFLPFFFSPSTICQVSYLRWHKFMMIFHVANQKSTQNLFTRHVQLGERGRERENPPRCFYRAWHSVALQVLSFQFTKPHAAVCTCCI